MYKAIVNFTDLQDGKRAYAAGDTYPREGYSPPESRINELLGDRNKLGKPVIEEIVEDAVENEIVPETAEDLPKRKKRRIKESD